MIYTGCITHNCIYICICLLFTSHLNPDIESTETVLYVPERLRGSSVRTRKVVGKLYIHTKVHRALLCATTKVREEVSPVPIITIISNYRTRGSTSCVWDYYMIL